MEYTTLKQLNEILDSIEDKKHWLKPESFLVYSGIILNMRDQLSYSSQTVCANNPHLFLNSEKEVENYVHSHFNLISGSYEFYFKKKELFNILKGFSFSEVQIEKSLIELVKFELIKDFENIWIIAGFDFSKMIRDAIKRIEHKNFLMDSFSDFVSDVYNLLDENLSKQKIKTLLRPKFFNNPDLYIEFLKKLEEKMPDFEGDPSDLIKEIRATFF